MEDKDTEAIFEKYEQKQKELPTEMPIQTSTRESNHGALDKAQSEIMFDSSRSGEPCSESESKE